MAKAIYFFLLFIAIKVNIYAQKTKFANKPQLLSTFGFTQLTGGSIILKAQIDNFKDTLNFVFDTGSGGISLDSTTVEQLGLNITKSEKTIRGIAGLKKVEYALKHTLKLPNLSVDSLNFHINNYNILSESYGVKIDGIIGYSFLRKFIIYVNYDVKQIKVYSPGSLKYPKYGYLMKPKFSPLPLDVHTILDQQQTNTNLIFDTGAGLNLLLSEEFVNENNLLKKNKPTYYVKTEGLGGQKLMKLCTIKMLTVGKYKFRNVPTMIFEDDFNVTNFPVNGGIIGNDILRRFNLIINYPDFCIHLQPNSYFSEPFDYTYTGLSIFLIDNKVVVFDVINDSPAAKAGLKEGDQIFAINDVYTGTLNAYKSALQNSNNKVKIIIVRNGKPQEITLIVKNIKR